MNQDKTRREIYTAEQLEAYRLITRVALGALDTQYNPYM